MSDPMSIGEWGQTLRVALPVIVLSMVAAVAAYMWPIVYAALRQDDCAFGTISNEQYLAILQQAKIENRSPIRLRKVRRSAALTQQIQGRVDAMLTSRKTFDEKLAAIHATMRSMGAIYRATLVLPRKGELDYLSERNVNAAAEIRYAYYLDANRYRIFWPFRRWITIYAVYNVQKAPVGTAGTFSVLAFFPELLDPSYMSVAVSPDGEACPIILPLLNR